MSEDEQQEIHVWSGEPESIDTESIEYKWPDIHRTAFGPGSENLLDARLDWIHNESDGGLGYYLNAYREAAEAIYKQALERAMIVEYAVLPLAYLWRHHIELALKDVIVTGRELRCEDPTKSERDALKGHKLLTLWSFANVHVAPLGSRDAKEPKNTEANLRELDDIDPYADGFRYPFNRDRTRRTLGSAPSKVNIVGLHEAMEAISNFLSGVRGEIARREEFFREYEHEMSKDYGHPGREAIGEMRRRYMEEHRRDGKSEGEAPSTPEIPDF